MPLFQLVLQLPAGSECVTVQYEAEAIPAAIALAAHHASSSPAALWYEGQIVCRIGADGQPDFQLDGSS